MKKAIIVILCIIVTATLSIGLCFATNSFKDWNPNNWGNNIKDNIGETSDLPAGQIYSEKYGTFDIPKQNMFVNSMYGVMIPSGTDMTSFYIDIVNELNRDNGDSKNSYTIYTYLRSGESIDVYSNCDIYEMESDFTSGLDGRILKFKNNVIEYNSAKLLQSQGFPYLMFMSQLAYSLTSDINEGTKIVSNVRELQVYEYDPYNLRCLSVKFEIVGKYGNVEGYVPLAIKSDKGYLMTDKILEEIKAEYEARGEEFPE